MTDVDVLGYIYRIQSSATGSSEGIVILWKDNTITTNNISITPQAIHVIIKVSNLFLNWLFSVVYASNDFNLVNNSRTNSCPLLL